jgi:hypothetical protein
LAILIIWFSGRSASIQTVPHGQFYFHFPKIKIRTMELHYSGEKIVLGFNFKLIQSISGTKNQTKNVEKLRLTWLKYVYWLFLQPGEQSRADSRQKEA